MESILPLDAREIHEPQVCFVHQGSGLEGVAGPLARHVPVGQSMQFVVD